MRISYCHGVCSSPKVTFLSSESDIEEKFGSLVVVAPICLNSRGDIIAACVCEDKITEDFYLVQLSGEWDYRLGLGPLGPLCK